MVRLSSSPAMSNKEWVLLLILSVLWGGSFFFGEVALAGFPPLTLACARVGFAALALWAYFIVSGSSPRLSLKTWGLFLVMGALNNVIPFSLILWGQTHIASALAAILNATTPLFTLLLAQVLTKDERLSPGKCLGIALGFLGVVAMIGPDAIDGLGDGLWPQIAILGAALSYAFAAIFGRRFRDLRASHAATGQLSASTLILLPIALYVEKPWSLPMPSSIAWSSMLCLALFSTAVAYLLYFRILKTAGASNLLLVTFLIPASALLLSVGILGEQLTSGQLQVMSLIALGLVAVDGRLYRLLRGFFKRALAN